MKLGIISALDREHQQLAGRLQNKKEVKEGTFCYVEGVLGKNEVVLTQCGIGKVNAAIGASELIRRYHPDCVLSTGVAGGIDTSLQVTDVVVSNRLVYHDVWCGDENEKGQVQGLPTYFEGYRPLLEHALSLDTADLEMHVREGLICTGDQFISDKNQLADIKRNFPAGMAVDMESAAIAQACYLFKTPFLSFRIISDIPGAQEDHYRKYFDFWETLSCRSFEITWRFLSTIK